MIFREFQLLMKCDFLENVAFWVMLLPEKYDFREKVSSRKSSFPNKVNYSSKCDKMFLPRETGPPGICDFWDTSEKYDFPEKVYSW